MAESYPSFYGKEPNIDISLFGDAAVQGTNIGNAIPGKVKAIVQGTMEGLKQGADIAQEYHKISQQPVEDAIRQEQLKQEQFQTYKQGLENQVLKNNEALAQQATLSKLEAEAKLSQQKLNDINNTKVITEANASRQPGNLEQILNDPGMFGTLSRNKDLALQTIAAARAAGVNKDTVDKAFSQFDAIEIEKQRMQLIQSQQRAVQAAALKQQEQIVNATADLQALSPKLRDVMNDTKNYDPNRLTVVPAGAIEIDPNTKQPKFDAAGMPIVAAKSKTELGDDSRYFVTYNGKVLDTLDATRGAEAAKSMGHYRLGVAASSPDGKFTPTPPPPGPAPTNFQGRGLADTNPAQLESQRLDSQIRQSTPATTAQATPTLSQEVLAGKSPGEQAAIQSRFNEQLSKIGTVPREYRDVVAKVNSIPALSNAAPAIKALASVESAGNNDAKSPTGVTGLLQITQDTWNGLVKNYPNVMKKADRSTPEGQVLGAKVLLVELLNKFDDMSLAFAAYNAGPAAIAQAVSDAKGSRDWSVVKEHVKNYVSPEKYKEVENYPERVLKYYNFYA